MKILKRRYVTAIIAVALLGIYFSTLSACQFLTGDVKPTGKVKMNAGDLPEHTEVFIRTESYTHTIEDIDFGAIIDRSDIEILEIQLKPALGWELAITKRSSAKMIVTAGGKKTEYDMKTSTRWDGDYAHIEFKDIPAEDFTIGFEVIAYEWNARTTLKYNVPERVGVPGGSKTDASAIRPFIERSLDEFYIRFEEEYDFGFGTEEIKFRDFVAAYKADNSVKYDLHASDRIVIYCYTHNDNDNYFTWTGSVSCDRYLGVVESEEYVTDAYTGKKYSIYPILPTGLNDFTIKLSQSLYSSTGMLN